MDFSLKAYHLTEYLEYLLAGIKLVAFSEIKPLMVCGGSFTSLIVVLGTQGKRVRQFRADKDLFPWTKGFANAHGFCCHSWSKLVFGAFSLYISVFLMVCSSVLGLSGHIHVGIIVLFSTDNVTSLFLLVPGPFLTPLSCSVILCAWRSLVSWETSVGGCFFLGSRDLLYRSA